jgi:hypothetical protein
MLRSDVEAHLAAEAADAASHHPTRREIRSQALQSADPLD